MNARVGLLVALVLVTSCKRPRPPAIKDVWLGPTSGCVRDSKDAIQCFGAGVAQTIPARVELSVRAGESMSLALGRKQSCIGDADGTRCFDEKLQPKRLIGGTVLSLAVGESHACVVRKTGEERPLDPISLNCWGENDRGQLGTKDAHDVPEVATDVGLVFGPLAKAHPRNVVVGDRFTCVESVNGEEPGFVRCFGAIDAKLFEGEAIKSLAAGGRHACVVKAKDGSVWCWGANDAGQLGDGGTADATAPVAALGVLGAADVALGSRHSCARHPGGTVTCWGANDHHQLANGTTAPSARPTPMHGLVTAKTIVAGGDATCVLLKDGDARCWGRNDVYQLGDGTTVEHVVPSPIKLRPEPR